MKLSAKSAVLLSATTALLVAAVMNSCDLTDKKVKRDTAETQLPGSILTSPDTDGDGLSDKKELEIGTDPRQPDTDDDGLLDGAEVNTHQTNPLLADSDQGGVNDGDEVSYGLNPILPDDDARAKDDKDQDGLPDLKEIKIGTDPDNYDTDDDGLSDGSEVLTYLTNPLIKDTDSGGINDGTEVSLGLNPLDSRDDSSTLPDLKFVRVPETETESTTALFVFQHSSAEDIQSINCYIDDTLIAANQCVRGEEIILTNLKFGPHFFKIVATANSGKTVTISYNWLVVEKANLCGENPLKISKDIYFAPTIRSCEFGVPPNLKESNGRITAEVRQSETIDLPFGAQICGVNLGVPKQTLQFDDHLVLTWNDVAVLTNTLSLLTDTTSTKIYSFDAIKGKVASGIQPYCFGDENTSSAESTVCEVPLHDTASSIQYYANATVNKQLTNLISNSAKQKLELVVVGDNDPTDCQHTGLNVKVDIYYQTQPK